jgi:hypothetical protein
MTVPDIVEVTVRSEGRFIETAACSRRNLADGRPGVLWRGMPYLLLADDVIELTQPAIEPVAGPATTPVVSPPVASLQTEDSTWVLVQGMAAERAATQLRLEQAGVAVQRFGRWLGDDVDGVAFDWFILCQGTLDGPTLAELLGRSTIEADATARVAVLERRLLDARADLAQLASDLKARQQLAQPLTPTASSPDLLADALAQVQELETRLADVPPPSPSRGNQRLHDELAAALTVLRPDLEMLRDSLLVATATFVSRTQFYRSLQELPGSGARPNGWKSLRGADRWWERHVSTGQDDSGRVYARYDTRDRRWTVLLGVKSTQSRDIDWLARRP